MSHAAEGSLQAYIDGEVDAAAEAGLRRHLGGCAACSAELAVMRSRSERAHAALSLLDRPAPMLRAQARLAGAGTAGRGSSRFVRLGAAGFAKAAMLMLALAGAGAAAIPGSPVRRALESTITRVAQFFNGATPAAPVEEMPVAAPSTETSVASIIPADGRVRIVLHEPAGAVDVTVRLIDGPRAQVAATMADGAVRFTAGTGRLEAFGLVTGAVTVDIPRAARGATVEVGDRVRVYKEGGILHLEGPEGGDQGSEVRFRIDA